jgi:hypothetical protein
MRTYGRLLALGALCIGALGVAAVPASAVTISLGGQNPTVPVPLPLPVSISVGVDSGGLQTTVQAPGSTDVSVKAGPSGLHAKATVANHPLAAVDANTPAAAATPTSIPGVAPIAGLPVVSTPVGNNTSSDAPTASLPASGASRAPDNAHVATAPRSALGAAQPLAEQDLSGATPAGDRTPEVTAEIASSPSSGFLHALPGGGARILLWVALAGAVFALRLFVGSTRKATPAD